MNAHVECFICDRITPVSECETVFAAKLVCAACAGRIRERRASELRATLADIARTPAKPIPFDSRHFNA